MTFSSSVFFARSLVFPKAEKKSSARRSLFGAMLCIGLSVVPLIAVISITNGMVDGMTERIIGLSSNHLQAYVAKNVEAVKNPEAFCDYAENLKKIDGVKNVYPEVDIAALGAGKSVRTGIELRAVKKDIFKTNPAYAKLFSVVEGDVFLFGEDKQAIIGKKMAEDLNLHAGDTFRVITTRSADSQIVPKLSSFKVGAIVSSGYQELDQFWCFIPLDAAYKNLSMENAAYNIMIETPDPFSPQLVGIQHEIKNYFGRYANVYRWDQIHSAEFENFSSTKVMLVFVMMLIVLVASVNISSAIVMLVMERQKEIAILKSIGATPSGITLSFLMTGAACGCGGLIFGIPLGILFTVFSNQLVMGMEKLLNLGSKMLHKGEIKLLDPAYYLTEIPVEIPWGAIALIVFGVIILSVLVSYIPAKKAGKEKPLDILRKN